MSVKTGEFYVSQGLSWFWMEQPVERGRWFIVWVWDGVSPFPGLDSEQVKSWRVELGLL